MTEAEWDAGGRLSASAGTEHLRHGYSECECYDMGVPRCHGGLKKGTRPSLGRQESFLEVMLKVSSDDE